MKFRGFASLLAQRRAASYPTAPSLAAGGEKEKGGYGANAGSNFHTLHSLD
jgi:hypothetical protein